MAYAAHRHNNSSSDSDSDGDSGSDYGYNPFSGCCCDDDSKIYPTSLVDLILREATDVANFASHLSSAELLLNMADNICYDHYAWPEEDLHRQLCACVAHCLKLPGMEDPATVDSEALVMISKLLSCLSRVTAPERAAKAPKSEQLQTYDTDLCAALTTAATNFAAALQHMAQQQQQQQEHDCEKSKGHLLDVSAELLQLYANLSGLYPGKRLSNSAFAACQKPFAALGAAVLQYLRVAAASDLQSFGGGASSSSSSNSGSRKNTKKQGTGQQQQQQHQQQDSLAILYAKSMVCVCQAAEAMSKGIAHDTMGIGSAEQRAAAATAGRFILADDNVMLLSALHLGVQVMQLHIYVDEQQTARADSNSSSSSSSSATQQQLAIRTHHKQFLRSLGLRALDDTELQSNPGYYELDDYLETIYGSSVAMDSCAAAISLDRITAARVRRLTAASRGSSSSSSPPRPLPAELPVHQLLLLLQELALLQQQQQQLDATICALSLTRGILSLHNTAAAADAAAAADDDGKSDDEVDRAAPDDSSQQRMSADEAQELLLPLLLLLGPAVMSIMQGLPPGQPAARRLLHNYTTVVTELCNKVYDEALQESLHKHPEAFCSSLDLVIRCKVWLLAQICSSSSSSSAASGLKLGQQMDLLAFCMRLLLIIQLHAADNNSSTSGSSSSGSSRFTTAGHLCKDTKPLHGLLLTCSKYCLQVGTADGSTTAAVCCALAVAAAAVNAAVALQQGPIVDPEVVQAAEPGSSSSSPYSSTYLVARCLATVGQLLERLLAIAVADTSAAAPSAAAQAAEETVLQILKSMPAGSTMMSVVKGVGKVAYCALVEEIPSVLGTLQPFDMLLESQRQLMVALCAVADVCGGFVAVGGSIDCSSVAVWLAVIKLAMCKETAAQLTSHCADVCAWLPQNLCCNYHGCVTFQQVGSELDLVRGKKGRCSGCHKAKYCSVECQKKHWKPWHKAVCKSI